MTYLVQANETVGYQVQASVTVEYLVQESDKMDLYLARENGMISYRPQASDKMDLYPAQENDKMVLCLAQEESKRAPLPSSSPASCTPNGDG